MRPEAGAAALPAQGAPQDSPCALVPFISPYSGGETLGAVAADEKEKREELVLVSVRNLK